MGKVISIASGKGGVGKSTLTANLGAALAQNDKKVLLVDMDLGLRNLDLILGIKQRITYHLLDAVHGICRLSQTILAVPGVKGLFFIPAPQTEQPLSEKQQQRMCEYIALLAKDYDYLLLDCPAGRDYIVDICYRCSQHVIIVATCDTSAIHDSAIMIDKALNMKFTARDIYLIMNQLPITYFSRQEARLNKLFHDLYRISIIGCFPCYRTHLLQGHQELMLYQGRKKAKRYQNLCQNVLRLTT